MVTQKNSTPAPAATSPEDFQETQQFDIPTAPMGLDFFAGENINLDDSHEAEFQKQDRPGQGKNSNK